MRGSDVRSRHLGGNALRWLSSNLAGVPANGGAGEQIARAKLRSCSHGSMLHHGGTIAVLFPRPGRQYCGSGSWQWNIACELKRFIWHPDLPLAYPVSVLALLGIQVDMVLMVSV